MWESPLAELRAQPWLESSPSDEVEDERSPERDLLAPTDWTVNTRHTFVRYGCPCALA